MERSSVFIRYCAAGPAVPESCVHALEPNPASLCLLRANLDRNGVENAFVHSIAVFSSKGEATFHLCPPGRAAYSSLVPEDAAVKSILVETETLDDFCTRLRLNTVDFLKIDVEGAEIEVLKGALQSIAEDRFRVLMIEATELNLRRSGAGTRTLFETIHASGLRAYRFEEESLALVPREFDGPICFDNLFLAKDAGFANCRLRSAGADRLRIAREVIRRGRACDSLYRRAEFARDTEMRMRELLSSRYLALGWGSRLIRKPGWVAEYLK